MLPSIGFMEMAVIAVVAILLFGSNLPEVARNFGRTYTQFRKSLSDLQSSFRDDDFAKPKKSAYTTSASARLTHYKDAADSTATGESADDGVPRFVVPTSPAANETDTDEKTEAS